MNKTIYNTFVKLKSQRQADKLVDLCKKKYIDYYLNNPEAFKYIPKVKCIFVLNEIDCILVSNSDFGKTEVLEKEFIELLNKIS